MVFLNFLHCPQVLVPLCLSSFILSRQWPHTIYLSSCTVSPVYLKISASVSIFFSFLYLRNSCPFAVCPFLPSMFALNSIFLYQFRVHLQKIETSLVILVRKGMEEVLVEPLKDLEKHILGRASKNDFKQHCRTGTRDWQHWPQSGSWEVRRLMGQPSARSRVTHLSCDLRWRSCQENCCIQSKIISQICTSKMEAS